MSLFRRKKKGFVDWTNRMEKPERAVSSISQPGSAQQDGFNFLGSLASSVKSSDEEQEDYSNTSDSGDGDDKRKKLAKRLMEITEKLEDLSNQIYHLKQRVELLEQKMKVGKF
jgi:predicted RNase H-like nuclease (RuvC/YqgF family)